MELSSNATIDFLERWEPGGPWLLMAIQPDRKSVDTKTFRSADREDLAKGLDSHNGRDNLYFHVNPIINDLSKKAHREDIKSLAWLHVDIDPRAGEDLDEERARALGLLQDRLPKGVPPPTVIIFSGGGYQGFWRLEEPLPINGEEALYETAKLYNIQLELLFSADNCHNVDRIMRLPGTINIPDARKRKKGRVETLAELVEFNDLSYPIEQFTKAPELQTSTEMLTGGGVEVQVQVSGGEVERVQDVSELDTWDVPDRVKIIMAQGNHPDLPKKGDNSRSAWLFDFCCQMIRAGVPDDVLYSIITDPDWPISESVVEHKANAEKYALRQIQRAKEDAIDPWLAYFNKTYTVIKNLGGRCLVITEVYDEALRRTRLSKMTLENFEKGYENKRVKIGEDANGNDKHMPAGKWWRKNELRKQFDKVIFAPEQQVSDTSYNLWKGFAVQSVPGDCDLFLAHVHDNLCNGSAEHFTYLMGWMARAVQYPGEPGQVAVVMRGGRGVGKSVFAKVFGSLFGRHYMQVSNSSHLVGNFNSHLRDLIVLFADEAFYAGDKKHESILKTLVTEDTMAIEGKGVDIESGPNYIHLIMAANDAHVVPAGRDERRYFVIDVGARHQRDSGYFKAMLQQLDNGGREALLHALRHHDLENFEVRDVPMTDALQEQKLFSLSPDEEWWYQKLLLGQLLYQGDDWPTEVMARQLAEDYIAHCHRHHISKRSSQTALGRFLARVLPVFKREHRLAKIEIPGGDGWTREKTIKALFYKMPSLRLCRERWEALHGSVHWSEDGGSQEDLVGSGEVEREPPF